MELLASLVASLSVFLFVLWYLRSKNRMEARIRALAEQERLLVDYHDPFAQRVAFPLVHSMVNGLMAILPTSLIGRSRTWLVTAGDKVSLSQFFTVVLLSTTTVPAIVFIAAWAGSGGSASALAVGVAIVVGIVGFFLPFLALRRLAKNRQKRIWRSLPNAMDLLTVCVEAGLSLDFAMQRVSERYKGALSEEIQRTLRETAMGKTRREALTDMAERVDLPDVQTFVTSIVQAETLGTSIGQVLRTQAEDLRRRRRQRAEQMARQAPVKMAFPLVLFLLPSLFIVTIGPVILNTVKVFSER